MPQTFQEILKKFNRANISLNASEKTYATKQTPNRLRMLNEAQTKFSPIRDEAIQFAINHSNTNESIELLQTMTNLKRSPIDALSDGSMPLDLAVAANNTAVINFYNNLHSEAQSLQQAGRNCFSDIANEASANQSSTTNADLTASIRQQAANMNKGVAESMQQFSVFAATKQELRKLEVSHQAKAAQINANYLQAKEEIISNHLASTK